MNGTELGAAESLGHSAKPTYLLRLLWEDRIVGGLHLQSEVA